ncbi:MAG: hypothetical protein RJQ14_14325 [Marinoscillum sp.]
MSKRQVNVALSNLQSFVASTNNLNIVMKNGAVYLASPVEVKSDTVKVKNTKGHILHLPLAQIEEIWAEEKAN